MKEKNCDNCAHLVAKSEDQNGNSIVSCELNEYQMYFPFAEECVHWDKAPERDDDD